MQEIKSASIINILPFVFLYILKTHQKQNDIKCENDRLYKYIPDKSKKLNSKIKWILLSLPILLMLLKSSNNESLEHTFVLLSHAIMIKTAMHFMSPCLPKEEFTNITFIMLILNLIYFDIIPKEHMKGGYISSILYSLFLISKRETTSANIIVDFSLAHFVFLLPKVLK